MGCWACHSTVIGHSCLSEGKGGNGKGETVSVDVGSGKHKKTILEEAVASLSWTSENKWNLGVQGHDLWDW